MSIQGVTPILNVSSVPESILWLESLGWSRSFTWNDGGLIEGSALEDDHGLAEFGGVRAENAQIFLCQDGQGGRGEHSAWMTWWIETKAGVLEMHEKVQNLGYKVTQPVQDEPWGIREFHLQHPDGHIFRISSGMD